MSVEIANRPTQATAICAAQELAQTRRELETLYAALDNVQSGLLILDGKLQAVYSNPALHRLFKTFSQQEIRSRAHTYEELLRASQAANSVDAEDYVASRLAWVRSGEGKPMDLKMSTGSVVRCHLAVLPDNGRMLIYSDVTDIVRGAEALEQLATTDGMTGIYNRRHFMTLADLEWSKASRYERPLSLLLLDIDHFKAINDTYGHQVGDEVIVRLAALATSCKRTPDLLARIGGEEFALLLPETDLEQAAIAADRLRAQVASDVLSVRDHSIRATVSIGTATRNAQTTSLSQLIAFADKALYEAKRAGRNCVRCCADEVCEA